MPLRAWIGLALIAAGIIGIAIDAIPVGTEETAIDAGPVQVEAETTRRMKIPLYAGIVAIVAGVGILLYRKRNR